MTLDNLLAIHKLVRQAPDKDGIAKLLRAAERNLTDAALSELSNDNRFDAAYKTILQCALIALWAKGYRTSTSQPGHHQTAIQTLPKTMGVASQTVIVLDALRKQRNINDYEGDPISHSALRTCQDEATALLVLTRDWLAAEHPDLIE
ncbi:MAG: DNA-binding protein [Paludibacterium sp.]|uniref:DNA-binding protein n=1 Tax=Paludibacterium sp. TaxID=1917523 RepID=UPI0025EA53C6|nr:DNA-binding protein [Paludibacterium sp.]MBV8046282.1 DNA-binding protein [Paludibacterium sp.]MBV8648045.1 DNA-binding protein [Paludibacterium sp.]